MLKVAEDGSRKIYDEKSQIYIKRPTEMRKNRLLFDNDWNRIGKFLWVSDVNVDGKTEKVLFQIHKIEKVMHGHGIRIFGAFVYPQGQNIDHDPTFLGVSLDYTIPEVFNVLPYNTILLQFVIVTGTIAIVLGFKSIRRKKKKKR
jgi:hypothetical protein